MTFESNITCLVTWCGCQPGGDTKLSMQFSLYSPQTPLKSENSEKASGERGERRPENVLKKVPKTEDSKRRKS